MAMWRFMVSILTVTLVFGGVTSCLFDLPDDTDSDPEDGEGDTPVGDPCNGTVDCEPGSICWNDICIEAGALRFSLVWTEETDLDIHVETPAGSHIYYSNPSADGGELDVDDCVGSCAIPGGNHVENVFFVDGADSGTYTFWVHNYSGSVDSEYTLEVAEDGDVVDSHSGTVPASGTYESEHYTHSY